MRIVSENANYSLKKWKMFYLWETKAGTVFKSSIWHGTPFNNAKIEFK